jgi:hypothetical protein
MWSKSNIGILEGGLALFCGFQYPYSTFFIPNGDKTVG